MSILKFPRRYKDLPTEFKPNIYKTLGEWRVRNVKYHNIPGLQDANHEAFLNVIERNEKEHEEQEANKTSQ